MKQKILAWSVHAYTAIGGLLGLWTLILTTEGQIREAFLVMVFSMIIDATDGTLARRARVTEVLPNFNGGELDNVIDFLNFIWIPAFMIWRADLVPHTVLIGLVIVAGLYAYGQVDMKTEDGFFLGFPSYWNVIVLYLFWLRPGPLVASLCVIIPGILSFIPTRYLWSSRNAMLAIPTLALGVVWGAMIVVLLLQSEPLLWLVLVSLFYPAYYLVASFVVDGRIRARQKSEMGTAP